MSKFDLTKKAEKIDAFLLKKGIKKAPIMRVNAPLDISGSMHRIIENDLLQQALNQLMGAAMRFDDNGELDVFKFDDHCEYVGTCTPDDYTDYIRRNHIHARGGTAFSPIVQTVQDFFFKPSVGQAAQPAKKGIFGIGGSPAVPAIPAGVINNMPVLTLVITDGEISSRDRDLTNRLLEEAEDTPNYYHFVGVGGTRDNFPSIAFLADERPNVGEVYLPNFGMSDDEVYEQLICDELVEFIGKFEPNTLSSASA